jgi:hypothetical protein
MGRHIKTESDLSAEEKICLHGYFVDASMLDECYNLCHRESKATDTYRHNLALRWVRKGTPQRAYLDSLNKKLVIVGKLNQDGSKDTTAESNYVDFSQRNNVIEALSKSANEETDSLRRTKILSEIADLQRMDRDETKDDKQLIHFFLPLTCKRLQSLLCGDGETQKKINFI